ncbi:MAG: hypothetical protein V3V34_11785 [Kiloniellales bacterium]
MPILTPPQTGRRLIEVRIGPPGGQGLRFVGEVNRRPGLVIGVKASHTSGAFPSKAKIKINNLSEQSIHAIERTGLVVEVLAGVDFVTRLFRGDVSRVETKSDTPTRETSIEAADGQRVYREAVIIRSWPKNTKRSQVFQDLLLAMGVNRGFISPSIPERVYAGGLTWTQAARGLMDFIWDADKGERWTLTDGAVDVMRDSETKPGNVVVLGPDTGLIGSPARTKRGAKIKALFDARIRPNRGIQLRARFLKGLYRVVKSDHDLVTTGLTWFTTAEAVKV